MSGAGPSWSKRTAKDWLVQTLGPALPGMLVLAGLGLAIMHSKAPWCDEGWFAAPAFEIAFRGNDATRPLEPAGHYLDQPLTGINQRTFVVPPLHLWLLAGWYRMAGPGLTSTRLYGLGWGILGIATLTWLAVWALRDWRAPALFGAMLSVDLVYIWASSDGRMDIQTAVLGWAALAVYLRWRLSHLSHALVAAATLLAIAALHHPNAIFCASGIGLLALLLDRRRLRPREVLLSALPFVVAGLVWIAFIYPDFDLFRAQFAANAAGRANNRFQFISQPWMAVWSELAIRYFCNYGVNPIWLGAVPNSFMLVLPLYGLAAVAGLIWLRPYRPTRLNLLLGFGAIQVVAFTFLSFKAQSYLIFVTPFWNLLVLALARQLWNKPSLWRVVAPTVLVVFFGAQLSAVAFKVQRNERRDFEALHRDLQSNRLAGDALWAPTYWGVDEDPRRAFLGYREDIRLGFHTGKTAHWVVLDRCNDYFELLFLATEKPVHAHYRTVLTQDFSLFSQHGQYRLYRRNPIRKMQLKD